MNRPESVSGTVEFGPLVLMYTGVAKSSDNREIEVTSIDEASVNPELMRRYPTEADRLLEVAESACKACDATLEKVIADWHHQFHTPIP